MWRRAVPLLSRKSKVIFLKMAQACSTGKLGIALLMGSIIVCNVMGAILMSEVCSKVELKWPQRTLGVGVSAGFIVMLAGITLFGYVMFKAGRAAPRALNNAARKMAETEKRLVEEIFAHQEADLLERSTLPSSTKSSPRKRL